MTTGTTTALSLAKLPTDGSVAAAVAGRKGIFEQTQAAEEAVLRPQDCGRWPHSLRAAIAARIAQLNAMPELAKVYLADADQYAEIADPTQDGNDADLGAVLSFMDKVATEPKNVTAADVSQLQKAGIADADIVRLAELNAFLAYQIRVIQGLSAIAGQA